MKARMEYENTLLKESLEKSKKDYEKLNKQLMEMLETADKKIEQLQKSNEMVNQNFSKGISNLSDSAKKVLKTTSQNINTIMTDNLGEISKKSTEYILEKSKKKTLKSDLIASTDEKEQ